MPGGDDGEKKEETAESREEAKEQVNIVDGGQSTFPEDFGWRAIASGAPETASYQRQGEGENPVLPKAKRGGKSREEQNPWKGFSFKTLGYYLAQY